MDKKEALAFLKEEDKKINLLQHASGILSYDMETHMPEKASEERGEQLGILAGIVQDMRTSAKLKEAVNMLHGEELEVCDKALVRVYEKFFRTEANLPSAFLSEYAEACAKTTAAWIEAREKDDYSIFAPELENMIRFQKEMAALIAPDKQPYDALLDLYEEGMNMEMLDKVFSDLESSLHSLMDEIGDRSIDNSFLLEKYDVDSLHEYCLDVVKRMGFDFSRGSVARSTHPFTTTLGRDDIRITTRYTDPSIMDPISSIVHEAGHALYEMNAALADGVRGTSLSDGASMGIHESQSRFWENLMGKSYAYWQHEFPLLSKALPGLEKISLEDYVKAVNKVEPSAIRVNADEVTYSLHIILRYRIEKAIFCDNIPVSELPSLWNELSEKIIRYTPKNNQEGILQDCHWAGGMFGYFPTYALGNLYGAMFLEKLYADEGGAEKVDAALSSGNWEVITSWQKKNIWCYGCTYTPSELLKKVTGRTLDATAFKNYLNKKYKWIYSL